MNDIVSRTVESIKICKSQINTKENPIAYDCLHYLLEGHRCICPYKTIEEARNNCLDLCEVYET